MKITVLKVALSDEAITAYIPTPPNYLANRAFSSFEESFRHLWKDSVKEEVDYNLEYNPDLTEEQKAALDQGHLIKFLDDFNKDGSLKKREVEEIKPEEVCFIPMVTPKRSSDYRIFKLHTGDMMDPLWDMDPEFLSEIDEDERIDYVNIQCIYDIFKGYSQHDIWSHLCHGGMIYVDNKHRIKPIKPVMIYVDNKHRIKPIKLVKAISLS